MSGSSTESFRRAMATLESIRRLNSASAERRRERRSILKSRDPSVECTDETGLTSTPSRVESRQACAACRKAKTRCLNVGGESCARCSMAKEVCVYPVLQRKGRKADQNMANLLNDLEHEISQLANTRALRDERPAASPSIRMTNTKDDLEDNVVVHKDLHNPMDVLENDGNTGPSGERLFCSNIYSINAEHDTTPDPVIQGIITEDEVARLVGIYARHLRPFFMHLDLVIHTPLFLRMNSPFLTTAVCAVAASFDPCTSHHVPALTKHAHLLASRVFADGSKSLEIVQAFLTLAHWAGSDGDWGRNDRSWAYQGQAMRLACEIRLDFPASKSYARGYRYNRPLTEDEENRLVECRRMTYLLACLSEFALATQSGRADTTSGHRLLREPNIPRIPPDDPINRSFTANVLLNHVFARALHQWHGVDQENAESGERERFMETWSTTYRTWSDQWFGQEHLVDVYALNTHIMLILLSLRVRGTPETTRSLLSKMHDLALQLLGVIRSWYERVDFKGPGGLAYAPNSLIVNVAYSAVLVPRLSRQLQIPGHEGSIAIIQRIAQILEEIAIARLNATSFASHYAAQIRSLLLSPPQSTGLPQQPAPTQIDMSLETTFGFSSTADSSTSHVPLWYEQWDTSYLPLELDDLLGLNTTAPGTNGGMWDSNLGFAVGEDTSFLTDGVTMFNMPTSPSRPNGPI